MIRAPVREREKPQYQHNRRYNHMEIHLNETAHRVVGIAPLERRSKSHGNARGVYEPGNKDIRRCHCADKRIVRNLLCPLDAERRKPRANKIHVYEHVGLNCEERQDIKFSVIDRAEFFVIFELVTAQPVYDNQKTEHSENHQKDSERLVFCEFAFFVHNTPLPFPKRCRENTRFVIKHSTIVFSFVKISSSDENLRAYIINYKSAPVPFVNELMKNFLFLLYTRQKQTVL